MKLLNLLTTVPQNSRHQFQVVQLITLGASLQRCVNPLLWTVSAVLTLSTILCPPVKANVESECQTVIQNVESTVAERHNIRLLRVEMRSVEDFGYRVPRSNSGETFPRAYMLVLPSSNQGENFLSSPSLMQSYAQVISDQCRPVSMVAFGLEGTGWVVMYGINGSGDMRQFECVEHDRTAQQSVLQWGYDYACDV